VNCYRPDTNKLGNIPDGDDWWLTECAHALGHHFRRARSRARGRLLLSPHRHRQALPAGLPRDATHVSGGNRDSL
jgi:hypothetical protein